MYIERILGCEENDMNKKNGFRWKSITLFFKTLLLGKRLNKMQIYPKKEKKREM